MNPKKISDLDPKLKETYERVMGTSFNPSVVAPARPLQKTVIQQNQQVVATQPVVPSPEMVSSPQMPKMVDPFKEVEPPPADVLVKATVTKKKKSLLPIILTIGGLIFFVCYAVFWAKIFGLF